MPDYLVELMGECREVYHIKANSERDARANWMYGSAVVTEAFGMEVRSIREDES